ncbi:hypothetical protein [Aquimarina rubra]|uniref:Uncharacterized protein n=1 Tax=Aquimarina rubra TaxID=1920033 RepID=A0ABW5LCU5_9FLAO
MNRKLKERNNSMGEFATVDQCSLRGHLRCVYTTGKEVYRDGRQGRKTIHWWRMSYIGRACTRKWGKGAGVFYEALFAVPHYIGILIGNLAGYLMFLLLGAKKR